MNEAELLLNGPRGRRLCGEVARVGRDDVRALFFDAARRPEDGVAAVRFAAAVRGVDPEVVRALPESVLLGCFADAVAWAWYWQEPAAEDVLLAAPAVVAALAPIAAALVTAAAAGWWNEPVDLGRQRYVEWLDEGRGEGPRLAGAMQAVRAWWEAAVAEEREARSRPADPRANVSGTWWSTPSLSRLVPTSRERPGLGALHLLLVEDDPGFERARVWPLSPRWDPRIYEITGPAAWAALVERYPLRVTRSRRHDWWRATGREEEWFVPDWRAVADDHDGVHLTGSGYLTTAGSAVKLGEGATMLAGWHPDTTYWLRDVLESSGDPADWIRREPLADGPPGWEPAAPLA